jgi:hypothetical protein
VDTAILHEVDKLLGCKTPPAIEYLFVEPYSQLKIFGFGIPVNPYGQYVVFFLRVCGCCVCSSCRCDSTFSLELLNS